MTEAGKEAMWAALGHPDHNAGLTVIEKW